jgi:tetratricopeptide (TPR) repeat protein
MTISHRLAVFCAVWLLGAAPAKAQIPDKFTNLKVLPRDISRPELIKVMRAFSNDLGVRCFHCHTARDPNDFSSFNWASDQKPEKDVARAMMGIVKDTNETLEKVMGKDHAHLEVTCFTCHHGNQRPETLADALVPVLEKEGPDAAAARYRELRKERYGSAAYDFGEWSLVSIAEDLARDPAQVNGARALLNLNLEFYPESAATYARMAETYIAAGDTTTAMTNFDRALTLAPEDEHLKQRVDAIKAKKKP